MTHSTLSSLLGHKAWANAELFGLLETVPEQHAERLHFCARVLNHIYVVDRIFRALLSGEPRPYDATGTKETPLLTQLRQDVAATDAWYMNYSLCVTATELAENLNFTFTDGDSGRMSREEILLHVITHGSYHRGNVGQVLRQLSIAPPPDLYTKFLHGSEPARRSP
jgi:uncharacterized damage-inducible protein DinB